MADVRKSEDVGKSDHEILVTRAILEEVKEHIGLGPRYPDEQMLAWMQRMTGRPVKLVEELPEDEEIVVICSQTPVVPGSLVAQCSECGVTVYHSRKAPPNSRKICMRCGPRLGH